MQKSGRFVRLVVAAFALGLPVCILGITPASATVGDLTFVDCVGGGPGCVSTGGPQATAFSLAVSHNGKTLYAGFATMTDGGISRFSLGATGSLSYADCISGTGLAGQCAITSTNDPGALKDPSALAVSPNDRSLYVADQPPAFGGFVDHLFAFPDQGGKLQWDGCYSNDGSAGRCAATARPVDPLADPIGIAVSPDGSSVYEAGSMPTGQPNGALEGSATHFLANADQGQLTFDGCTNNDDDNNSCTPIPGEPLGMQAQGVAVSPSGQIYVGGDSAIARFAPTTGGGMPFYDCISNDGSGEKCTHAPGTSNPFHLTRTVDISSDGKQLYALTTSGGVDHLTLAPDGRMNFADCVSDDTNGGTCAAIPVAGGILFDLTDIALSPDGTSLYAVSSKRDTITVFSIGASGALSFDECLTGSSVPGCTTVPAAISLDKIAVSRDSKSVYVTADSSILHFARATAGSGTGGTGSGTGSNGSGSNGTGTSGTGSSGTGTSTSGTGNGASGAARSVSATVGDLKLSLSLPTAPKCYATTATLHPSVSLAVNAKSKAVKWSFTSASAFMDRGIRHVRQVTVRRNGKNVKVTQVTFSANQLLKKPGALSLKLKGLQHGTHTLTVQLLLQRHASSGSKVLLSTTKPLRMSFKVC